MQLRNGNEAESPTPTPWAIHCIQGETQQECCNSGNLIFLTKECYLAQLGQPDSFWSCPRCGGSATWSDENYEEYLNDRPKAF